MLPWQAELELIHALIESPAVARELHGVLRETHFQNPAMGKLAVEAMDLWIEFRSRPTQGALTTVLGGNGKVGKEALRFLPDVLATEIPSPEWAQRQGRRVAAEATGLQLASRMPELLEAGAYDTILKEAKTAAVLSAPRGETQSGAGTPQEVLQRHAKAEQGLRCPTGLPTLDNALQGGLKRGWFGQILGMKGVGKTHTCAQLVCEGLRAGLQSCYVTLETSADEIQTRTDLYLLGGKAETESDAKQVVELKDGFHLVDLSTRRASVPAIEAALDRLPAFPDLVVVDYATKVVASSTWGRGEATSIKRFGMEEVASLLRELAARRKVFLWSPYQANREGAAKKQRQDAIVGVNDIAEGYSATWHADTVISLNQNEAEERMGLGRVAVLDTKQGRSGFVIPCEFDWATSTIREVTA